MEWQGHRWLNKVLGLPERIQKGMVEVRAKNFPPLKSFRILPPKDLVLWRAKIFKRITQPGAVPKVQDNVFL
ncbi:hypothetical protein [Caldithrix abyssi]